jgi:hypothetical protein
LRIAGTIFEDGSDENADYESDENSDTTEIDNDVLDIKLKKPAMVIRKEKQDLPKILYCGDYFHCRFAGAILLIYLFMKRPENKWERKGKNESFE